MYVQVYVELTVCYEENFVTSANFKECKYKDLVSQCRKAGWRTELSMIQVGSRGLIDQESFEGLTNFTGVKTKDPCSSNCVELAFVVRLQFGASVTKMIGQAMNCFSSV